MCTAKIDGFESISMHISKTFCCRILCVRGANMYERGQAGQVVWLSYHYFMNPSQIYVTRSSNVGWEESFKHCRSVPTYLRSYIQDCVLRRLMIF